MYNTQATYNVFQLDYYIEYEFNITIHLKITQHLTIFLNFAKCWWNFGELLAKFHFWLNFDKISTKCHRVFKHLTKFANCRGAKDSPQRRNVDACRFDRSRKMLKNESTLARWGVDTAENGPKVDVRCNEVTFTSVTPWFRGPSRKS